MHLKIGSIALNCLNLNQPTNSLDRANFLTIDKPSGIPAVNTGVLSVVTGIPQHVPAYEAIGKLRAARERNASAQLQSAAKAHPGDSKRFDEAVSRLIDEDDTRIARPAIAIRSARGSGR